jgi:hypothetical protein
MLSNVLSNGLTALASVTLSLVAAGITAAIPLIRQHFKNRFVADSLSLLTTIAGTVVGSVVPIAAKDLPNASKAGFAPMIAGDLKTAIIAQVKTLGASALTQLQNSGGFSAQALDTLVTHLVAQTIANLTAVAGSTAPAVVPALAAVAVAPTPVAT